MLTQEQITLLTEGARCLQVELSAEALTIFSTYIEELLRWGRMTDLVSQNKPEVIIRKHILDSLALVPLIPIESRLLDLGSGAGFPGLPLAVAVPSLAVTLLEARRKRANFLKEVVRKAKIVNTKIAEGRAEALAKDPALSSAFGVVVTRATWNIEVFLKMGFPFVTKGGLLVALKGPQLRTEILEMNKRLKEPTFPLQRIYQYELPFGQEKRAIAIFSLS